MAMAPHLTATKTMVNNKKPAASDLMNSGSSDVKVKSKLANTGTAAAAVNNNHMIIIKGQNNNDIDRNISNKNMPKQTPSSDERAKRVLKEAVDAVVNSFAKHSQGCYGRGESESVCQWRSQCRFHQPTIVFFIPTNNKI